MVEHEESKQRFVWSESGEEAYLSYHLEPNNTIVFNSTVVPKSLGGKGIGSKLVKAGLAYAESKKMEIKSTCSFVSSKLPQKDS